MDPIREAFQLIKQDILEIKQEICELKQQIKSLNSQNMQKIADFNQTIPIQNPTQTLSQTDTPTHIPTLPHEVEGFSSPNLAFSTGNRGVPTDKPTDRQTNQQTDNLNKISDFARATEILDNLDNIKKEIRLKFKRLTSQEMLVFSTLYSLQEQNFTEITYKTLANNLNLSQSSIRDYINKLIIKGIPVLKIRQNNKKITLFISKDLQKIASLSTITQLRDL